MLPCITKFNAVPCMYLAATYHFQWNGNLRHALGLWRHSDNPEKRAEGSDSGQSFEDQGVVLWLCFDVLNTYCLHIAVSAWCSQRHSNWLNVGIPECAATSGAHGPRSTACRWGLLVMHWVWVSSGCCPSPGLVVAFKMLQHWCWSVYWLGHGLDTCLVFWPLYIVLFLEGWEGQAYLQVPASLRDEKTFGEDQANVFDKLTLLMSSTLSFLLMIKFASP